MKIRFHLLFFIFGICLMGHTTGSRTIVFFGDSLTAGYGINENEAYPALVREKLQEEGKDYNVINAGLSGETSAGGLRRIDWLLRSPIDVFVLGLGANDGLRGLDLETTYDNLRQIIGRVTDHNADVRIVIAGMQVPPNLGDPYSREFREMYTRLADEYDALLIPFLLEGVAGDPELNMPDGIHPNPEGHEIIAGTVWENLKPLF
ncbi:MAG: arylesterase [Balneolales bacterium]